MELHIVWFKRDFRVNDHAPLWHATRSAQKTNDLHPGSAAVIPLYVIEPEYWQQEDASQRQWHFIKECLEDLNLQLQPRSPEGQQPLKVYSGRLLDLLDNLRLHHQIKLYSHEETGNDWTYQRDKHVLHWCRSHQVQWHEFPQFGVIRPNPDRDQWTRLRQQYIDQPMLPAPDNIPVLANVQEQTAFIDLTALFSAYWDPTRDELPCPGRQTGGSQAAYTVWQDFLTRRGEFYRGSLSSPLSAEYHCSRISPYLAWGCISLRELIHDLEKRRSIAKEEEQKRWSASLASFESRLWWHCHFIQKLEDEPEQEWRSLHPAYRNVRQHNEGYFQAWAEGKTGWPMADASMRYLLHNGWINFRMRAMLMSLACYPLWLPWQQPARYLAKLFVDYEPGIHYPQAQMQSGETGINVLRMYNPTQQAIKQDPDGVFIRRWVPELRSVSNTFIHQPWLMNTRQQQQSGVIIGKDYPAPAVDFDQAVREAKAKLKAVVQGANFHQQAQQVGQKHGSRKRQQDSSGGKSSKRKLPSAQMDLF